MAGINTVSQEDLADKNAAIKFFEHYLKLAEDGDDVLKLEVTKDGHVYKGEATLGPPP